MILNAQTDNEIFRGKNGAVKVGALAPWLRGAVTDAPRRKDGQLDMRYRRSRWAVDGVNGYLRDWQDLKEEERAEIEAFKRDLKGIA